MKRLLPVFIALVVVVTATSAIAQSQFPISKMWDEAWLTSRQTGRYALIFNVDNVDTMSIAFRDSILSRKDVQKYLSEHFEIGQNDFSVDPPPSVGFDSLRHLGLRLSALEERYRIVVRPTAIMLRPDGSEVDRISFVNRLTPGQFMKRLEEMRQERNTIGNYVFSFWEDTTSEVTRLDLIERFEQRSEYDSVVYHLAVVARTSAVPEIRRTASIRHAYLRFQVEKNVAPLRAMMNTLTKSEEDSILYLEGLQDILDQYQRKKQVDSAAMLFEEIIAFTGVRSPDLLNDYAWELANFGRRLDFALDLVNEAIEKRPDDENFYDTRALIYLLQKKFEQAYADGARAHELADNEEKTYFKERMDFYKKQLDESLLPKEEKTEQEEDK